MPVGGVAAINEVVKKLFKPMYFFSFLVMEKGKQTNFVNINMSNSGYFILWFELSYEI